MTYQKNANAQNKYNLITEPVPQGTRSLSGCESDRGCEDDRVVLSTRSAAALQRNNILPKVQRQYTDDMSYGGYKELTSNNNFASNCDYGMGIRTLKPQDYWRRIRPVLSRAPLGTAGCCLNFLMAEFDGAVSLVHGQNLDERPFEGLITRSPFGTLPPGKEVDVWWTTFVCHSQW
jgi:hypothetical protein